MSASRRRWVAASRAMTGRRPPITEHCCQQMHDEVEHRCEQHPDPYDCPESLVRYVATFDEYGLIVHDGGTSYVDIAYCPWCGSRLPESKRDRWFAEMKRLGVDPWNQAPPPAYRTDAWFREPAPAEARGEAPGEAPDEARDDGHSGLADGPTQASPQASPQATPELRDDRQARPAPADASPKQP